MEPLPVAVIVGATLVAIGIIVMAGERPTGQRSLWAQFKRWLRSRKGGGF